MEHKRRTNLASGVVLILIGLAFLVFQVVPGLRETFDWAFDWPAIIVVVAFGLLVIGLATGTPDMVVPACIVGGIGGILYWQNATGRWESWSYVWALIPGFGGLGTFIAGLIKGKSKDMLEGFQTMIVSAVLFAIFASFFGVIPLGPYWPLLLIVLGLWVLVRNMLPKKS